MKRYATSSLFILSILLIQNSRASKNELNDELRFLYREIGLLKDENQNQNYEIAILKEMVGFQNNNTIHNNKIPSLTKKELDEKKNIKSLPKSTDQDRVKRPVRLLPPHLFRNEKNETTPIPRFYGPPANCSDLARLGYTLNGFYQVQSNVSTTNEDGLATYTIYCAFKQPEGTFNPNAVQKRVISVSSVISKFYATSSPNKSSGGVHFHVEMTSALEVAKTKKFIQFKNIVLNMGGGYKSDTGVFTAPKTGIYQFTFSGSLSSATNSKRDQTIGILLDVNNMKRTHAMQVANNQLLNRVTSKFYQGDTIAVQIINLTKNDGNNIFDDLVLDIATFSGFLLEEFVH